MSKTIEGVPECLTRDQYLSLFEACGFDPSVVVEMRMAHDGVHALVFALDEDGNRRVLPDGSGYAKHRVFIPVRRSLTRFDSPWSGDALREDTRTTRVTPVTH